jgi:hypothetical protein
MMPRKVALRDSRAAIASAFVSGASGLMLTVADSSVIRMAQTGTLSRKPRASLMPTTMALKPGSKAPPVCSSFSYEGDFLEGVSLPDSQPFEE